MKEFDYELDYKSLDFTDAETRKLYRIGRGEQGVLLVRPYTNDICAHWRFVDEEAATKSSDKIYSMFCEYKRRKDFIGMDMARKFLEMGLLVPDGMPITLRDGNMHWECISLRGRLPHECQSKSGKFFKKVRDKGIRS